MEGAVDNGNGPFHGRLKLGLMLFNQDSICYGDHNRKMSENGSTQGNGESLDTIYPQIYLAYILGTDENGNSHQILFYMRKIYQTTKLVKFDQPQIWATGHQFLFTLYSDEFSPTSSGRKLKRCPPHPQRQILGKSQQHPWKRYPLLL